MEIVLFGTWIFQQDSDTDQFEFNLVK